MMGIQNLMQTESNEPRYQLSRYQIDNIITQKEIKKNQVTSEVWALNDAVTRPQHHSCRIPEKNCVP